MSNIQDRDPSLGLHSPSQELHSIDSESRAIPSPFPHGIHKRSNSSEAKIGCPGSATGPIRDMTTLSSWMPYMTSFAVGKALMERQQCHDELRALLRCFITLHYAIGIEDEVLEYFIHRNLINFGRFFCELEQMIGSRLAMINATRIRCLEQELEVERCMRGKAEDKAAKAAKNAGQVAAALLGVIENEHEQELDLATDTLLARLYEFADYNS